VEDIAGTAEEGVNEFDLPLVTSVILQQDETELEKDLKLAIGILLQKIGSIQDAACERWKRYKENKADLISFYAATLCYVICSSTNCTSSATLLR
jgi:hypothetical protein